MENCCYYSERNNKLELKAYQSLREFFRSKLNKIRKITFDLSSFEYKSSPIGIM